jgi:hypothetical protein
MGIGFRVDGCSSGESKALSLPKVPKALSLSKGVATRSRRRLPPA